MILSLSFTIMGTLFSLAVIYAGAHLISRAAEQRMFTGDDE